MIVLRRADERGRSELGWLDSRHTFSFSEYHDPQHMGFRSLRVINEDRVQAGHGFPKHSHHDMEILSLVLEGALAHEDSLGNESVIRPGEVQRMSAGTGVTHSEYNASKRDLVHFLQIWILPRERGLQPGYEQRSFPIEEKQGALRLVASSDGRDGSLTIHQDVNLYSALVEPGRRVAHDLPRGRHAWLQVARCAAEANGHALVAGDGAALSGETRIEILAPRAAEILLFDLA